ncbi:hypothetical protein OF83DRAFT_1093168 [Amylostereum chailletii]|nr:hypothetical protein OF83DRAFT_1093168 [Amylostereum chailletii]
MSAQVRAPKPTRKGPSTDSPAVRRAPAWTGARASPTFSPGPTNTSRLPNGPPVVAQTPPAAAFPPLNAAPSRPDNPQEKLLQTLGGLTGTTITLLTKTAQRYEGVIVSTSGEGDTKGVTIRDVKEISSPDVPTKEQIFIASTNIESWQSGPADAKAPNGDGFKIDTDISKAAAPRRERELQAWHEDEVPPSAGGPIVQSLLTDDLTFGPGASGHTSWDQFAANEKLFGVKAGFDEDVYTTKLDRSAADFKEREKRAQALANEIMGSTTNNAHVAEERLMNSTGDSGTNEEDKYGAVVRGTNAYVPPGARKQVPSTNGGKLPEVPKVSVNAPDGTPVVQTDSQASSSKAPSPAPSNASTKPPADALPAFRDFVTNEKQRLTQKRQTLMKNEREKRMADLMKFSQSFKLNKPIPDDLVNILAKDEEKQKAIKEKSAQDAASAQARAIGVTGALSNAPAPSGAQQKVAPSASAGKMPVTKPLVNMNATPGKTSDLSKVAPTKNGRISMVIQPIPPFKGAKSKPTVNTAVPKPSAAAAKANAALSPANKLNVNASSFRPNPKAVAFTPASPNTATSSPIAATSPKPKTDSSQSSQSPNPFFGKGPIKKTPVHIKDAFNPFNYNKVAEAPAVTAMWPYQGKRYTVMFPAVPPQPQQHSPHMVPPGPPPMPPPSYEEDTAQQAARAGYVYAPYYAYPGQPMMPGMGPPPGPYMPGPFMQPMPYPPSMPPPNAMYPSPQMGQMPPPGAYMQPPPGQYPPPPNGAGPRPSMPPTPIPAHAHPYYHQSPQSKALRTPRL